MGSAPVSPSCFVPLQRGFIILTFCSSHERLDDAPKVTTPRAVLVIRTQSTFLGLRYTWLHKAQLKTKPMILVKKVRKRNQKKTNFAQFIMQRFKCHDFLDVIIHAKIPRVLALFTGYNSRSEHNALPFRILGTHNAQHNARRIWHRYIAPFQSPMARTRKVVVHDFSEYFRCGNGSIPAPTAKAF